MPAAAIVGEQGRVYTLDISPLAVDRVQRKIDEASVTNVETVLADAAKTGLPGESFDLAFLFGLAHPRGGLERIWLEMHRLLRTGGILAIEGRLQPPKELFSPVKRQGRISQFQKTKPRRK